MPYQIWHWTFQVPTNHRSSCHWPEYYCGMCLTLYNTEQLSIGVNSSKKKVMSRPFGVSLLIAGVDNKEGPVLWCSDPSGTNVKYRDAAIGCAHEGADAALQEGYKDDMSLEG